MRPFFSCESGFVRFFLVAIVQDCWICQRNYFGSCEIYLKPLLHNAFALMYVSSPYDSFPFPTKQGSA